MAKTPLGRTKVGTPNAADPVPVRVEQVSAAYAVAASRTPASIIPQGAAGAWLLYRDRFLNSSAQTQISEIRKGAPASNLIGLSSSRPSASWPGTKRSIRS